MLFFSEKFPMPLIIFLFCHDIYAVYCCGIPGILDIYDDDDDDDVQMMGYSLLLTESRRKKKVNSNVRTMELFRIQLMHNELTYRLRRMPVLVVLYGTGYYILYINLIYQSTVYLLLMLGDSCWCCRRNFFRGSVNSMRARPCLRHRVFQDSIAKNSWSPWMKSGIPGDWPSSDTCWCRTANVNG